MLFDDALYMRRCLELALNGSGTVAPNPMVGCVIVNENNIIGEGFHQLFGGPHAEVHAIQSVHDSNKSLLQNATLYVNLEPCSHTGKTPPCSQLIIDHKIPRIVIGTIDPNPLVAGSGIKQLAEAGCKVKVGVLETESKELNRRFFTSLEKKRPYVILKWAQTIDGKIGLKDQSVPVSNHFTKSLTHKWRSEEACIMVGTNTVSLDNPKLDARHWNQRHPVRIVLDQQLRLSPTLHVFDKSIRTIIITGKIKESVPNLEYVTIDFKSDIAGQILQKLSERNLQSVFIEGGALLLQTFIESGYWDEARVFIAPSTLPAGINAPQINEMPVSTTEIEDNTFHLYRHSQ